jgi:hypothetical protein
LKAIDIPIRVRGQRICDSTSIILPLELENANELRRQDNREIYGNIDERTSKILKTLRAQAGITLQLYSPSRITQNVAKTTKGSTIQTTGPSLHVIIYGPAELFDAVGDFAAECGIYLQDPLYCDKTVQYRNPHLLSGLEEKPIMTHALCPKDDVSLQVEQTSPLPDLFSLLNCDNSLPEASTPTAIQTELQR